ncbi:MAG: glutathione S-transferase family protein [Myxococcota bacterium]
MPGICADSPLLLVGAPGSPYSRKMRAVLRYRRIPYRWIVRGSRDDRGIPEVRVSLIPVLVLPASGGEGPRAMIDSTFQIRRLESEVAERSVLPPDPAVAFVDALLEDYGDEWVTKMMFHYRWAFAPDVAKAAAILPRWRRIDAPESEMRPMGEWISERQIERLRVVGSNVTTAPVIESSYRRLLELLDAHLCTIPFLMGRRPGASDFGVFGQLTQLVLFDPTPMAIALERAPRIHAWCERVEDLSGHEVEVSDWIARDAFPDTLRALLAEVGRTYAPFLLANARALERGDPEVECEIDGRKWRQAPFAYQGKCLGWLRQGYASLAAKDRSAVDALLSGTGCERLFE